MLFLHLIPLKVDSGEIQVQGSYIIMLEHTDKYIGAWNEGKQKTKPKN
jgi:hypothetical protein